MDKEMRLQLARDMLTEHVQEALPGKQTHIQDVDLAGIDAHVCNLVACLLKHQGDLAQVNDYYRSAGLAKDYKTLIRDAQEVLDRIIPELSNFELKQYFARLSRMSIVAAEIGLTEPVTDQDQQDDRPGKEGDWQQDIRITADLDQGLLEFRKLIARKKLEEQGLNAIDILKEA